MGAYVGGKLIGVVFSSVCGSGIGIFKFLHLTLDAHCAQMAYPSTKGSAKKNE